MSEFAPEPVEPAEVEGAEVEAPAESWAGPSQEDWEAAQETLGLINQAIQEPAQQYQQQYEQPQQIEVDPLADNFGDQLRQIIREEAGQLVAPLQSYQEQLVMGEATERAKDIIHNFEQDKGEFFDPGLTDLALERANTYSQEAVQRFGNTQRAAEYALERAYTDIKALQDSVGKAYYERQINQIRGLSNAPREPGQSGQQAGQQVVIPEGGDEFALVSKYFQSR